MYLQIHEILRLQIFTCSGSCQTILSLPPKLPADLEEALKPYFTFTQVSDVSLYNFNP